MEWSDAGKDPVFKRLEFEFLAVRASAEECLPAWAEDQADGVAGEERCHVDLQSWRTASDKGKPGREARILRGVRFRNSQARLPPTHCVLATAASSRTDNVAPLYAREKGFRHGRRANINKIAIGRLIGISSEE